jgi:glycosyltransferase involved in cell wall biosynthesis
MHANYAGYTNPTTIDGKFFDEVIPGYFEPEQFIYKEDKEDYYLYIGRMIDRKGIHIASQVCEEMGKKLILAGPGEPPKYGEYVGVVGPERRAELMAGATALLAPTLYLEPFGNIVPEAHFSGTPTITTDWGAFVETNIHGVTGYRCRMFDEFCQALEDVKTLDPKVIRQTAMERYSLDVIAQKYDKYFRRLQTLWNKGWYER